MYFSAVHFLRGHRLSYFFTQDLLPEAQKVSGEDPEFSVLARTKHQEGTIT